MVTVINYSTTENAQGESYVLLTIQGSLEIVQSKESGRFYATVRKTKIPCTLDEATAKLMIGQKIPGSIKKTPCAPYNYTNPETGEVIQMNFRYEYVALGTEVIPQTKVTASMNGHAKAMA